MLNSKIIKMTAAAFVSVGVIIGSFGGAAVFAADDTAETEFSPDYDVNDAAEPSIAENVTEYVSENVTEYDTEYVTEDISEDDAEGIIKEPAEAFAKPSENSTEDAGAEPDLGETTAPETTASQYDAQITSYELNFTCQLDGWPRKEYAVFNIYSGNGELLGSETRYITDTEDFSLTFDLPAAPVGTVYYLEVSGLDSIDYYSENYPVPLTEKIPLYTYWSDPDENGVRTPVSAAYMTAHVRTQSPINIYVNGQYIALSSPAIFEDSYIIAPLSEVAEAIGITDCTFYPEYDSVKVKIGDNEMLVNIGFSYITVFGEDKQLDLPVSNINSLTYIELRPFVESFGCTLDYTDCGSYIDINLNMSPMALEAIASLEQRANESGIGSSTDYMIWVNKGKFRCTVFQGSKGNWKRVKDFTVGIGASGSETITGVFEYSAAVNSWNYANYYVGPVMIFYGNYAIHSTLLRYDGTPYNNNVGVKLSLGCVRCQPRYINWLSENIPLYTRVYVTEN